MSTPYVITKIRFVNFHNVGTVTLDLGDGGHLFLLGDNGSGKTTVLDAVHFVLTAGAKMEFNAAARIAGAKNAGGRTVQGIVMRYNIETNGPMNPAGGIAYAALEIKKPDGKLTSACVGFSARTMEEAYESWGVIAEGPVSALPIVVKEGGRERPARKQELREVLGGKGYYGQIGAYANQMAERFYVDRVTYEDVCQLLATGKAYREIAARAGDYDKLFRALLQEPPKDVFEELIRDLKSLDESKLALGDLEARQAFVREVEGLQQAIATLRINSECAAWQKANLAATADRVAREGVEEHCAAEKSRAAELRFEGEQLDNQVNRENLRLSELRAKDSQGLVQKERELRAAQEKAETELRRAQGKVVETRQAEKEASLVLSQVLEGLEKGLKHVIAELQRFGKKVPFSTAKLAADYDEVSRSSVPEDAVIGVSTAELEKTVNEAYDRTSKAVQAKETIAEAMDQKLAELQVRIDAKRKQEEAVPTVPAFLEAKRAVAEKLLSARALYEGLEPAKTLRPRERAYLEQVIGDAILGTWIVKADEADALRKLFFADERFREQSLAVPDVSDETRCDWLPRYFDVEKSDPMALLVLRRLMADKVGPDAQAFLDFNILHFRGRETLALSAVPRLLGGEARREQLRREIKELEQKFAEAQKERNIVAAELARLGTELEAIRGVRNLLTEITFSLSQKSNEVKTRRGVHDRAEQMAENAREESARCEEEVQIAIEKHGDVVLLMKKSGIEKELGEKIVACEKKLRALEADRRKIQQEIGAAENDVLHLTEQMTALTAAEAQAFGEREAAQKRLLALGPVGDDIGTFVLARCADKANQADALQNWMDELKEGGAANRERLRLRIVGNEGQPFGFTYEEAANALRDRRGVSLGVVRQEVEKQVAEQQSVINDNTRRVIKQIVMVDLIKALQERVMRLEELARKIGKLLKDRSFGKNRYAFGLAPNEGYQDIIRIVKNFHALDPAETEKDITAFIELHKDDIMSTEVGDVPAALDYRNWFRYELKILTQDSTGQTIDRKVKSLGSGGEQAVPNYLLILTIANFLYDRPGIKLPVLVFDEAFYGIDAGRRDQILAFATDLGLQLFVASPDQDGVKKEIPLSTSVLVKKDAHYNVHLYPFHWENQPKQLELGQDGEKKEMVGFTHEAGV